MKKFVLLVIALLAIISLAGCGGGDNDTNGNGNGNGNGDGDGNGTETAQWAAYEFGDTVKPASGGSGQIKTFTMESLFKEDGEIRHHQIEGTYEGTETVQIVTQKMVGATTENVTVTVACHRIRHRITVLPDDNTGEDHPDWVQITVWLPTDADYQAFTGMWLYIYPKASYLDSDGKQGEMSYYVTEAMASQSGTMYWPVVEGEFDDYDPWVFHGLYGLLWTQFRAYSVDGEQQLKVGSWAYGGLTYNISRVNRTIGAYQFNAWSVAWTVVVPDGTAAYEGVFSPDLGLPIYAKFGGGSSSGSSYYEFKLTDLGLG